MKATVVIPTKDPGPLFHNVLDAVVSQQTSWPFEVIVIDSGSNDGTVEYAKSVEDVKVFQIPPEEFGHGKTRNHAISLAQGEFVVLITHDALPENQIWLQRLVTATDASPEIAGSFGRHKAYANSSPFTKRDLTAHFENFARQNHVVKLDDTKRYECDPGYRQFLHFFSSNNACIRKRVWEKIPLPEVDFAEDQSWAKAMIEAGYSKAYVDDAVVYHSHDYGSWETGRRSFDESRAFKQYFNYDLCPNAAYLFSKSLQTILNDLSFAIRNKIIISEYRWVFACPFKNIFRQVGYYLGQRANRLPDWFVMWYSRDKALFRKGQGMGGKCSV